MDDVAPNLLLVGDNNDDDDDDERWNDTLYPVIALLTSNPGDCSADDVSAIASIDSSWIHQRMKQVQHQNSNNRRKPEGTSLEEKRLECIENFIVTVVKGKLRTGEACWPKTELKLLMSSPSDEKQEAEECRAIVPYTQHRKTRKGGPSQRASPRSRSHCNRGVTSSTSRLVTLHPISEKKKEKDVLNLDAGLGETNHSLESFTKVDALDEEEDDNNGPTTTTKNKYIFPPFHSEVRANMPKNNFPRRESQDNTSAMSGLTMPSALLSSEDDHQPMAGWVIQEKKQQQQHYTDEPSSRGGIPRRATMPEVSHQARLKVNITDITSDDNKEQEDIILLSALSLPIPTIKITRASSTDPPPSTNPNNNRIMPTPSPPQPHRTPSSSRGKEVLLPLIPRNKAFPPPPFNPKEPYDYPARSRSNSNNRYSPTTTTTVAAAANEPVSSSSKQQQSQIVVVPGLPPVTTRPKSLMVVAEELHIKATTIKATKDVGVGTADGGGRISTKQLFDNKQQQQQQQRSSSSKTALRGRGVDPPSSHEYYHRKQEQRTTQTSTARNKKTSTTTNAAAATRIVSSSNKGVGNIGSGNNKTSSGGGGGKRKQLSSSNKATATTTTTNTPSEAPAATAGAASDNNKVFVSHWGWRKQTIHRRASTGSSNNVVTSSMRNNTRGST
jgi:hypothetical protein